MNDIRTFADLPEDVRDASSCRLVVMLYDDVIAALEAEAEAAAEGAVEDRFNAVTIAGQLLMELRFALDLERGGSIAGNLDRIYAYVISRLPQINVKNDPQPARDAIGLLRPLRDAWAELDARVDAGQVEGFPPAPALADRAGKWADVNAAVPA